MKIDGNMFGAIDIAISGLKAHGRHMEVISSNIANARTTDAGNGEPYRRIDAIFKATDDNFGEVEIGDLVKDSSAFRKVLDPGHPNADEDGYVKMPNVDMSTELINLNIASRSYQANAAILRRYQKMVESSLELLR